ncbi:uncharacterized protein LOC109838051 [Asparagus officinalis]|uniref:uncharacterized protein LOC109838051 n=1 Tax=Asparagus officinalis TaxID=4686 RepID=UPI00098E75B5|nr:uncharacterized protein LOC109838051 [Asparagus officinalis]
MALEACSFQLTARASIFKDKKFNLLTNKEAHKRGTTLSSSIISFPPRNISAQPRTNLIRNATDTFDQVLEVTDNSWGELILDSKLPVALVEFWAPSCGPCKMMAPVMDELAKEYAGRVACFKINTDDSLSMASQYGVRSIPTVLLFKNGEQKESITGAVKKSALSATIEKHLDT